MKSRLFIILAFIFFSLVKPVWAGTDLTVSCDSSNCQMLPGNVALFSENNILPGNSFTQRVRAENTSSQNGTFAIRSTNLRSNPFPSSVFLADKMMMEIRENSAVGPLIYGPKTLTEMIADTSVTTLLSPVNANQFRDYYFIATFDPNTGNEYQRTASLFDLSFSFDLVPLPSTSPSPSGGNKSDDGPTTPAVAPSCQATSPTSAPVLTIISNTGDSVTLNWTVVSPVTHYAVNFGTQPGVYLYGDNNVGNSNSYVVGGLTPGIQYFFQVLAINDCAPGPRSNEVFTAGRDLAGAIVPAPLGFSPEQVLGVATQAATLTPGQVAGANDHCSNIQLFIPWLILLAQLVLILLVDYLLRNKKNWRKQIYPVLLTLLSIIIFYILRRCNCFSSDWLAWICRWYFIPAGLEWLILQLLNYALIEDVSK